jgi:hypothetical protein
MHLSPKQRVQIVEPRCEMYQWRNSSEWKATTYYRIEIAGEPLTCAWLRAQDAWAAALRALRGTR